uniref:Wall-associated receptor kinase C-terminal domain-containing protein n=1 Tax=Aegilops tauschii TaxID=37682 RepID=M8B431_AEGTA
MHIPAAAAVLCSATLLLTAVLATHAQNTTMTTLPSSSTSCDPAMCGGLRINGTFRVANTDLSDGSCDIILKVNASSDLGYAPFGISGTNQKLFFLYNCTDLEAQPLPLAWAPVNCTNANASIFNSFALLAGGDKPDNKWEPIPGSCTVSMMPVLGYPGATGADYRRLMNSGFLVEDTADDCRACEESGGFCRINTTYDIFECRCSDGMSDSIICHSSGNSSGSSIPGLKNFEFFVV